MLDAQTQGNLSKYRLNCASRGASGSSRIRYRRCGQQIVSSASTLGSQELKAATTKNRPATPGLNKMEPNLGAKSTFSGKENEGKPS